ncbi:MAG TPA: DUF6529 family protein [Actinomycetota bacterium]|nr:DUF6529 family protein [Actinomycetota bacterium]
MDLIGLLNDLTGGNLLLWKVVGATAVFFLAGLQVLLAARLWGVTPFPPVSSGAAARAHRVVGRAALLVAVLVAVACIAGPAGPTSPTRVLLHSVFGTLVFVILAAKFALLRVLRRGDSLLPWIGTALFLTFVGIWATSVADYVTAR